MTLEERNPLEILYKLLSDIIIKVPDINIERSNEVDIKKRNFIFPSFPEVNDDNYPRVAITFINVTPIAVGAGRYFEDEIDNNDNTIATVYGRYIKIDISVAAFVKKDQIHKIVNYAGHNSYAKNQRQADWLADRISKEIEKNYDYLIKNYFTIDNEITTTPAYEDNHFLFVSDVKFTVITPDIWKTKYSEGSLIQTININEDVQYA